MIAAFRATLEETLHGDVIVHVIDCSRDDYKAQRQDVIDILQGMGIKYDEDERIIEVYNKIDALDSEERAEIERVIRFSERRCAISALKGTGKEEFYDEVVKILSKTFKEIKFHIKAEDGKALSWLYSHSEVLERVDAGESIDICVMISPADLSRFVDGFGYQPL